MTHDAGEALKDMKKLLKEAGSCKRIIKKKIKAEPDNLNAHRVYCTYIRRTLEIQKTMIQAQSIDRELFLIAVLKSVVLTLIEKKETQAAEVVGQHLEDIGEKVREKWQDSTELSKAIAKSERSSNRQSPPSGTNRRAKSSNASNAP
ncbi:MAG: hypothetical protein NPINA01_17870 [Nitrospinaceae bacterium]|nr:MAG: hypothetical protein NPINA01_17870 [Nitrospinaceae bacterium]